MRQLLEFAAEDGGKIYVEAAYSDDQGGWSPSSTGGQRVVTKACESFQAALARIRPIATTLLATVRDVAIAPDQVEVEFGIRIEGDLGAIVAKAGAEAQFTIKLSWSGEPKK